MNAPTTTEQLSSFFEGLDSGLKSYREIRKSFDKEIAFDFNSINFFWPGENKVSEIFAFFLDPDETHGQGDTFLRCFLKELKLKSALDAYERCPIAVIDPEHPTEDNRRIDITINLGSGEYWIGIENKVGTAADQKNQIEDYAKYLQKTSNGKYTLFYLTPDGDEPSDYSIKAEDRDRLYNSKTLQYLSYSEEIINLFQKFEQLCQADNVRAFIREFNKHLKQRFRGETYMTDSTFISDFLKKSIDNQITALQLLESKSAVLQPLLDSFNSEIRGYCKKRNLKINLITENAENVINASSWSDFLIISETHWTDTRIGFQFEKKTGKSLAYGVMGKDAEAQFLNIKNKLEYTHGNNGDWPIFSYFPSPLDNWGDHLDAWKKMIQTDPSKESALMVEFREIIDPLLLEMKELEGL
jgi:hypothetical protein